MNRIFFLILFSALFIAESYATHNRAGEITYTCVNAETNTYQIRIVTYTYTPSMADRPELEISWGGDEGTGVIQRTSITYLDNDIKENIYDGPSGIHSYTGPGVYMISLEDPNRNGGIINIPGSVDIPFYIETMLVINPYLGCNNSPVLLNPPIDNACWGQIYIHNPGAYDQDGDSLAYHLAICKGEGGLNIPTYFYPPASNSFTLDPNTGDLVWDTPTMLGEFNVAFLIDEYRNGIQIGSVRRDMQIKVVECNNQPPVITNVIDTCVEAGTNLSFTVSASDPDNNSITLSGTGGPKFEIPAATFATTSAVGSVSSVFSWQTTCAQVQNQPYQMNFKAMDNGVPVHLVDFESVQITVVCPSPKNLTATPFGNTIHLNWDQVVCSNADRYKIYRRNGFYGYTAGYCETGVPAYTGYTFLDEVTNVTTLNYTDNDHGAGLIQGNDYCYMVIAYFIDGAESYASNEACATLIKDVPVITNVSVSNTDLVNGAIDLAWSKPTEFDIVIAPGPYQYKIYRSDTSTFAGSIYIGSTIDINDTTFIDTIFNTKSKRYFYKIEFWNYTPLPADTFLIGTTHKASSIFLTLTPSDNQLLLIWNESVPWTNDSHTIYRYNDITLVYDSIGISYTQSFADTGLINGHNYCYFIKSTGHYSAPGFIDPIINLSQIICGTPIDKTPPCAPDLKVIPDCDAVANRLIWTNPNHYCCNDAIKYNIYYSPTNANNLELIYTTNNMNDTTFIHTGLSSVAGCYAVTAVDSFFNESPVTNTICVDIDSCNLYHLPNVFTPNGDGSNDIFGPFPYDFVESVKMIIYNRWGEIVFKTDNPDINWDGKNYLTKLDCSDGVYYYICDVYEIRLVGLVKRNIHGFVHLIRN